MPGPCTADGSMGGPTQFLGLTSPLVRSAAPSPGAPTIQLAVEYSQLHR